MIAVSTERPLLRRNNSLSSHIEAVAFNHVLDDDDENRLKERFVGRGVQHASRGRLEALRLHERKART